MEIYLSFHLFKTRITATLASSLPFCSQSVSPVARPLDKLASAPSSSSLAVSCLHYYNSCLLTGSPAPSFLSSPSHINFPLHETSRNFSLHEIIPTEISGFLLPTGQSQLVSRIIRTCCHLTPTDLPNLISHHGSHQSRAG